MGKKKDYAKESSLVKITRTMPEARIEVVNENAVDLYPCFKSPQNLPNSQAMHCPIHLEIKMLGAIGLLVPHPVTVRQKQLYPEVFTAIISPGMNRLDELTIRNHHWAARFVAPDEPIARLIFLKAGQMAVNIQIDPE